MDLALGCDIRIMADTAKLAAAFTARGVLPESGGTWILPRLLGWSKAAELIFTGRTLTAAESLEMGLVSRVVPAQRNPTAAAQLAAEIARNAPLAVQASKRMMRMGMNETFNDHVHHVFLQLLPLFRISRLQGRHGVVPGETPAELHRQIAMAAGWQARLDTLAPEFEVPGASLAIWHKGRLETCCDRRDQREHGGRATPAAIFQIGSITKLLTANAEHAARRRRAGCASTILLQAAPARFLAASRSMQPRGDHDSGSC